MISQENKALTVGELSNILKACFENPAFSDLTVYGEVYSLRTGGKFSYLDLGDQGKNQTSSPVLRCAFSSFYGQDYGLNDVKVGDVIQIRGSLSYYPHGSSITLWGKELTILKNQLGTNLLKKQKTLEKLEKLGYLNEDRKRKIPVYCKTVAILTAKDGAAYQDILKTLHDRFPCSSVLYPITVQGASAAGSIVKAIEKANLMPFDALILGRGGGSKTDLSCFDDEKVALAIATCKIPVITCIGHTIDTAIADRVSDAKAITPTEGASLINPSLEDINERRKELSESLASLYSNKLQDKALALDSYRNRLEAFCPLKRLESEKKRITDYQNRLLSLFTMSLNKEKTAIISLTSLLNNALTTIVNHKKASYNEYVARLNAFDPSVLMNKGYAVILKDGKKVKSAMELNSNMKVEITFPDGRKEAIIK
jgi:exodeoxyribonuclease VII large subunit